MDTPAACSARRQGSYLEAAFCDAVDALPLGLVLFDARRSVILCNRRYREIYGFAEAEVQPGTPVSRLIQRRLELGLEISIDAEAYIRERINKPVEPSSTVHCFADGRLIAYTVAPLPGGGGIATHEDITERERLRQEGRSANIALRERNRHFEIALGTMAQGLCMFDGELRIVACNEQYRRLFKLPPDIACPGAALRDVIAYSVSVGRHPGQTAAEILGERIAIVQGGKPATLRTKVDGHRTVEIIYRPSSGGGWVVTYDDISEREAFEGELAEQNRRFDAALNNMPHGLSMFDSNQRLIVCNRRYIEMYALPDCLAAAGTPLEAIMAYRVVTSQGPEDTEEFLKAQIARAAAGHAHHYKVEFVDRRTLHVEYCPMEGGGWVSIHQDVTEAARAEAQINHLAHHDALTGLPNRILFRNRLDEALKRVPRGDRIAVLCLDLDQFKSVNDTLGHPMGDELLKLVAERLCNCVDESDTVTRLGGDEFAIIQGTGAELRTTTDLAARIIEAVAEPYLVADHQVVIGTSIGIAVAPDDGLSADQLLKNADLALYRAKADGRGVTRYFEPAMDAKVQARRALELEMRRALVNDEFSLWYQPLVRLSTQEVVAFEALLRWHHPARGLVPPAEFIPLAEDNGLIVPLGGWVLRQACAEAAKWSGSVKVSVNLSPVQFRSQTLALEVAAALATSGLSPSRLELEITETVLLQDTQTTLETLNRIKALGVSISMDDFGTGYSSLSYLSSFPFDKIKIDQSFVRRLEEKSNRAIVRAVTGLGRSLGMTVTAEGVETPAQLQALTEEGCTEVQGYLYSAPVPAKDVASILAHIKGCAA